MSSIAYASWLGQIERECQDCLPLNFSAYRQQILEADDKEARRLSGELYNRMASVAYKREERPAANEDVHLVMTKCPDGSMYLQDLNGHGVIRILRRAHGMYEISGPKFLLEIWGGRGVGDTFLRRMEDGDFMHDRYQTKRE